MATITIGSLSETTTLSLGSLFEQQQTNSKRSPLRQMVPPGTTPGGRLSLQSATPVMTADATAQGTIYYCTYAHNIIPMAGNAYTIGSDNLSLILDATNHVATNLYDIFAIVNSGAALLVTGPAWTNSTTRATAISLQNGIWVNDAAMTHAYNNSTDYGTVAQYQGTYLGTFYATANGQTGMAFQPAGAAGGTANILGLYNAYNRVRVAAYCRDSTASYTYGSTTWRSRNNSTSNRISWVDGLRTSVASVILMDSLSTSTAGTNQATIGTNLDSTSNAPNIIGGNGLSANPGTFTLADAFLPQIGFHYAQAMESETTSGTGTFRPNNRPLLLHVDM